MKVFKLRRIHRWIGLICALSLMGSASSGILHTVMTYLQDPPPRAQPAAVLDISKIQHSPADLLKMAGIGEQMVRSCSLCVIEGKNYYQIIGKDSPIPRYYDVETGKEDPNADQRYALEIARNLIPDGQLSYEKRLDTYDAEYIVIYRLLPVHLVRVADDKGTRLYVSTQTGSVARYTDNMKQFESNVFGRIHKWTFIKSKPLRDFLLTSFTLLSFVTAVLGIILFFKTRSKNSN
jgi:hypothetical protein